MRNCFDSHPLWISKRSSDFRNDFRVRVCVLDRTVRTALDSHHSGLLRCWRKGWDGIRVLPELFIGDSNRFFDSWLWSLPVSLFRSFSFSFDPDPVKSFTASSLFFSDPQPVITLAARYSGGVLALDCRLSNSMMMIHMNLWESLEIALNSFAFRHCLLRWISFSDEFNEFVCNCAELVLELMLGFMNVLELFCDFVILICNCQERENWFCLCWSGVILCICWHFAQ